MLFTYSTLSFDYREILKMGCSSTAERAAVKEFVKALGSLSPSSWINKNTVGLLMCCSERYRLLSTTSK
jgi:hypothetical protein